jgi:hypothetical protein
MLAANVDTVTVEGDPAWQLWRLRPEGADVGRPLDQFEIGAPASVTAGVDQSTELQAVDRRTGTVPALLSGTMSADAELVVAMNGTVAAVPAVYRDGRAIRWAAMVPESLLHDGTNAIELFARERGENGDELRPIAIGG